MPHPTPTPPSVHKLALTLGCFGFGGGFALIAMARREVVDQTHWLTDEEFLRDLAVAQAIPGGSAGNLMTLLGLRAGGLAGAATSLVLFMLPSSLLMLGLAVAYRWASQLRQVESVLAGLGPAVVAIVAAVGLQMLRKVRARWQVALAVAAAIAVSMQWLGVFQVVFLTLLGALAIHWLWTPRHELLSVSLPALALVFVQISLSMFGGGMAMIAAIDHQLVHQLHWLTPTEFADAVALSQITPGPLATASTFIGYRVAGFPGALVATLALFLPAFLLTLTAATFLRRKGQTPAVRTALDALSGATLGLIFAAAVSLIRSGAIAPRGPALALDVGVALAGAVVLLRGLNPLWVLGGAAVLRVALAPALGL